MFNLKTNNYFIIKSNVNGTTQSAQEYTTVEEAIEVLETMYWSTLEPFIAKDYDEQMESIEPRRYNNMIRFIKEKTDVELLFDDYDSTPDEYKVLYTSLYYAAYLRDWYTEDSPKMQYKNRKTVDILNGECHYYLSSTMELLDKPKEFTPDMAVNMLEGFSIVTQESKIPELNWVYISADDDILDAFENPAMEYYNLCKSNPEFTYEFYSEEEPDSYPIVQSFYDVETGNISEDEIESDPLPWKQNVTLVDSMDPRNESFVLYKNGEWVLTLKRNFNGSILPAFSVSQDKDFTKNLIQKHLLSE